MNNSFIDFVLLVILPIIGIIASIAVFDALSARGRNVLAYAAPLIIFSVLAFLLAPVVELFSGPVYWGDWNGLYLVAGWIIDGIACVITMVIIALAVRRKGQETDQRA